MLRGSDEIDALVVPRDGSLSCARVQPNCTARVMNLDGARRIIFSTLREISTDEELTYDYKFAADDTAEKKIPCSCGAAKCRRWLN